MRILLVLLTIAITSCETSTYLQDTESRSRSVDESAVPDADIDDYIAPYREQLAADMDAVVAQVAESMPKSKTDPRLGHWMADCIQAFAQMNSSDTVHFSLQNYGGIRVTELREGPLTVRKLYELMPFENSLVVVTLDADAAAALMEDIADSDGWPVSEGLYMETEYGKPTKVLIHGTPLTELKTIRVGMPDYIANGGDGSTYLADMPKEDLRTLIREVLIQSAKASGAKNQAVAGDPIPRIQVL